MLIFPHNSSTTTFEKFSFFFFLWSANWVFLLLLLSFSWLLWTDVTVVQFTKLLASPKNPVKPHCLIYPDHKTLRERLSENWLWLTEMRKRVINLLNSVFQATIYVCVYINLSTWYVCIHRHVYKTYTRFYLDITHFIAQRMKVLFRWKVEK